MRDKNYQKLRYNNIMIGIFGVIVLAFAIIAVGYLDYTQFRTKEMEKLKRINMLASNQIQTIIGSLYLADKILDVWIKNNIDKDPKFDPEFIELVETYKNHMKNKIDIRMVTADGKLYYFPSKSDKPLADVKDREYYKAQLKKESQDLYFAEPVLSRVTGKWGIPISYRIKSSSNKVFILFAAIEFDTLDAIFSKIYAENGVAVSIIRDDGRVLYRYPFDKYIVGKNMSSVVNIKELRKMNEGIVIYTLYTPLKNIRINNFQKINSEFPVYCIASDNYEKYFDKWFSGFISKIILTIVALAIFIILIIRSVKLLKQLQKTQEQLEIMARYDSLTGIKNRRYFFDRIREEEQRNKRNKKTFVFILIDIDNFKMVNDRYGHPIGDEILKGVGEILQSMLRETDHAGRVGGEEFGVCLPETQLDLGIEVAERIRRAALSLSHCEWNGAVSIGVTEYKLEGDSIEELYKRADDALYTAKNNGKNRVESK